MPEDHLTKIEGVPSSAAIVPGMAYWPGSGPDGTTCGKCIHRGYHQQSRKEFFDINTGETYRKTYRVTKCAMFRKMSGGKHGPAVKKDQSSCKYFEAKKKETT